MGRKVVKNFYQNTLVKYFDQGFHSGHNVVKESEVVKTEKNFDKGGKIIKSGTYIPKTTSISGEYQFIFKDNTLQLIRLPFKKKIINEFLPCKKFGKG